MAAPHRGYMDGCSIIWLFLALALALSAAWVGVGVGEVRWVALCAGLNVAGCTLCTRVRRGEYGLDTNDTAGTPGGWGWAGCVMDDGERKGGGGFGLVWLRAPGRRAQRNATGKNGRDAV